MLIALTHEVAVSVKLGLHLTPAPPQHRHAVHLMSSHSCSLACALAKHGNCGLACALDRSPHARGLLSCLVVVLLQS